MLIYVFKQRHKQTINLKEVILRLGGCVIICHYVVLSLLLILFRYVSSFVVVGVDMSFATPPIDINDKEKKVVLCGV